MTLGAYSVYHKIPPSRVFERTTGLNQLQKQSLTILIYQDIRASVIIISYFFDPNDTNLFQEINTAFNTTTISYLEFGFLSGNIGIFTDSLQEGS